jgi:peptidoglycan/xylan/chitin deacetylase (PgdA/CDA1 family)
MTIALTFDDGPDRKYTPRLLDILSEYNVQATFFVIAEKLCDVRILSNV